MRYKCKVLLFIINIGYLAVFLPYSNKGNGCEVRKAKYFFCLSFVFDAVIKVINKDYESYGGNQTEKKADRNVFCFIWPDGTRGSNCRINYVDVADGGCFGNTGLFVLLEEEGVDVARYFGETGIACQIALFDRDALQLPLIDGETLGKVRFLFAEVVDASTVGVFDFFLDFVNLRLHGLNRRVVFGVLNHERPFLYLKGGKLVSHITYQRLC